MRNKKAIRWNVESHSKSNREQLLKSIVDDIDADVAIVSEGDNISEVTKSIADEDELSVPKSEEGPQFVNGTDPQFIIITMETAIIILETGLVTAHLYELYNKRMESAKDAELVDQDEVLSQIRSESNN